MYKCTICGKTFNSPINFCDKCGGAVTELTPSYTQETASPSYCQPPSHPQASTPAHTNPNYEFNHTYNGTVINSVAGTSNAGKTQAIIGMILSLIALTIAIVSFSYFSNAVTGDTYSDSYYYDSYYYDSYDYYYEDVTEYGQTALGLGFFALALAVTGLVLSCVAKGKGCTSGMATVGKVFGLIVSISSNIIMFFSFIFLLTL